MMNPRMPTTYPRTAQGGFSTMHMVVLLVFIALAQVGLAAYQLRYVSETTGRVIGGQARNIKDALNNYLKSYGGRIVAGQSVTKGAITVANPLQPTLQELANLGFLSAVPGKPANGGDWVYAIETQPSTCTLPGPCNLITTVYPNQPLTSRSNPAAIDGTALNAAIAAIGADGGYSDITTPSVVGGAGGGWTRANKLGAVPGVLYAIGGYGSAEYTALRNVGEDCTTPGAVATSTTGQQLICRGTKYVTTLNSLPSYRTGAKVLVKDGDVVPKPTCEAGGTPAYSFEMTQTAVDVAIVPPLQSLYLATQDQTSSWRIVIHMKDRNTTDVSANPYSITAIFHVQCHYL